MGINGSPAALAVDRAISELRRGRAIAIVDDAQTLVVAALESAAQDILPQLLASSTEVSLILTAERAQAAGFTSDVIGPVALRVRDANNRAGLYACAGIAGDPAQNFTGEHLEAWHGSRPLAAAGFKLAKSGRLVPALLACLPAGPVDDSVVSVTLAAIRERFDPKYARLVAISDSRLPLADAENTHVTLFRDELSGAEHIAIVVGDPARADTIAVRLHSSCLTGDVLGSLRCDCGEQLRTAVRRIASIGTGVLLYLDQEGRGIGLANKLRAYAIQDSGLDTLDADRLLGFSSDERSYDVAAEMLQQLGIHRIQLMTNNPEKIAALAEHGIEVVGRLPLLGSINAHNEHYLRAKRERAGHLAGDTGS